MPQKNNSWIPAALFCGLVVIGIIIAQIPSSFLLRDWVQDYLSGTAALNNVNPWEIFNTLSEKILHRDISRDYRNPHTPLAVLLAIPFCFLPPSIAGVIWLFMEMGALMVALRFIGKIFEYPEPYRFGVCVGLCLAVWPPLFTDLANGQFQCFTLLLLTGVWYCLRQGRDLAAGFCLGAAIALKIAGLPLLAWLLFRKKWSALVGAALSWMGCHLVAAAIIGWKWCWFYYTEVAASANKPFISSERNFSIIGLGWRIFMGTSDINHQFYPGSRLIDLPALGPIAGIMCLAAAAVFLFRKLAAVKNIDVQILTLIAAGAVILPVAWDYYLLFTLPATLSVLFASKQKDYVRNTMLFALISFSLAGNTLIDPALRQFSVKASVLLSFWPLVGVSLLTLWLLTRRDIEFLIPCRPYPIDPPKLLPIAHLLLASMFFLLLIHPVLPLPVAMICSLMAIIFLVRGRRLERRREKSVFVAQQ
jgi:hypothetical protein